MGLSNAGSQSGVRTLAARQMGMVSVLIQFRVVLAGIMMQGLSFLSSHSFVLAQMTQIEFEQRRRAFYLEWGTTGAVLVALAAAFLVYLYTTRGGIIARATAKEAIRQPVFPMLMAVALMSLVINTYVPFFSLGDDVKMLEICGLATILICGMLLAIWTSSMSIADEIEGKTAMTLLSKPINRRQFIVGKFVGIQTAVLTLTIPVVLVFGALIYYKVFYDARESANDNMTTGLALREVLSILPPVILSLLEITLMSAISVAISTRMPMVVNMVSCLAIFVVGHLTSSLVATNAKGLELVPFMARVIATVLPAVEVFNVEARIMMGGDYVPAIYLGTAAAYSAAYATAAILLAFILFEDRDLA